MWIWILGVISSRESGAGASEVVFYGSTVNNGKGNPVSYVLLYEVVV